MAAAIFVNAESLKKMKMTTGLDWSEVASLTADELITVFFFYSLKKSNRQLRKWASILDTPKRRRSMVRPAQFAMLLIILVVAFVVISLSL